MIRTIGRRYPMIRSFGYLMLELRSILRHLLNRAESEFDTTYLASEDPWAYTQPAQLERIESAMRQVDTIASAAPGGVIDSALEIGCAEGLVTERLATRCRSLVAIDVSSVALERGRERCRHLTQIDFRRADVKDAGAWGPYELVVAMDVLECIRAPSGLRRARDSIIDMLLPGAHLVVTTTRQHPVSETAWWGRWIPVGARINAFVGEDKRLKLVSDTKTSTHAISVFRKSA